MSEILFLAHRIPYPPNKGDKIRSWRLLRALAQRWPVRLGTFVDREEDWKHVDALREMCPRSHFVPLRPLAARVRGVLHALRGASITEGAWRDAGMARWVRESLADGTVRCVFAFSSGVAQYAELPGVRYPRRIIDLCDVDSDKWRQFAERSSGPMRAVYALEHRRLARAEARWVHQFDATIVISEAERRLLPGGADHPERVTVVANGVDTEYFDPDFAADPVFAPDELPIVFTGAMDYLANVDGVEWFADEVFPEIRRQCPQAVFVIVGAHPAARVQALARRPGIRVTGTVPDVRPYLAGAACVAVALRMARGVQNKLLEAMAMARPVVATRIATVGVAEEGDPPGVTIADSPQEFAAAVLRHLRTEASLRRNPAARRHVIERFSWDVRLAPVIDLVQEACT